MISNPDRKILVLWVIAIALITRDELKIGVTPPRPYRYVGSAIVYGLAAIVSEFAGDLAFFLALGWTIAIAFSRSEQQTAQGPAPAPKATPLRRAA